ncbi:MAG: cell division ATP-binding protein FtsE [Candidatus Moranbacteria bacterium]|nr:cell division ATP-binding protein FtsE [Candidatus Moranbacteria bacterium]
MIKFHNVSKIYSGDVVALRNINLDINSGEFVSIVGQSGTGKSTLLRLLILEELPTMGQILFNNRDIITFTRREIPLHRRKIGVVFQDFKLLNKRTVFENVSFALEVAGRGSRDIRQNVGQILDIVGLTDKSNKYPTQLSGGEQQRVAIARALVHHPEILAADEPTGNLDMINTWEIIELLLRINKLGTTVLLATHNKDTVDRINRRVIALDKGMVIRDQKEGKYMI